MAFREAKPFLIIAGLVAAAGFFLHFTIFWVGLLAFGYILYFFRDPERPISSDPRDIVSSADGKVILVDECIPPTLGDKPLKRVAVFLSVFDVHVNRSPYAGKITTISHHPGEFLDARNMEVDVRNESQDWLIETPRGPVILRQIAGLIARRIVAWKREGDEVSTGDRIGMIRFGSRTDIYLPLECEILVQPGQRVQGGSTVLARWPESPSS